MNLRIHRWFRRRPRYHTELKAEVESLKKERAKLSNQVREKQAKIDRLKRQVRKLERSRNG